MLHLPELSTYVHTPQRHMSISQAIINVQTAQNKAPRIINFKEERHPCEPLFTVAKIINLTNIIILNNCMLLFDHLNRSPPTIFDDLLEPFTEQHSHNTRGARRCVLNIPKKKTSFYGSRSVQVTSIKDWKNITDGIHFTPDNFIKCSLVIKKIKKYLPVIIVPFYN